MKAIKQEVGFVDEFKIISNAMKRCGNCIHWRKFLPSDSVEYCQNIAIDDLIDRDDWARFEPPADFYCNKWEVK